MLASRYEGGQAVNRVRRFGAATAGVMTMAFSTAAILTTAALTAATVLSAGAALAQESYPNRPIRLVVGFAAGGGADFAARLVSDKLKNALGQTIIIDNKPGANGAIAAEAVGKAPPDGYTLFVSTVGAVAINPGLRKDLPYDSLRDFAPITLMVRQSPVLAVGPSMKVNTAAELVARAKQSPSTVTIGITGVGAISHLGLELFESAAGVKFVRVPYRGSGPAFSDVLGGQVNGVIIDAAVMLEHIRAGTLKALGMTAAARTPFLPEIPTLVEQGYADVVADNWTGVLAPASTPPAIVAKLNAAFVGALNDPDIRRRIEENGSTVAATSAAEFRDVLRSDMVRWERVIREKGIKPE
jgi:tripartite-type tricarboxylate transporter receptor subunit TctC